MAVQTVVVVDDDDEIRAALAEVLTLDGYSVLTARDGRDALQVLRKAPRPCVALVDLIMPRVDGWQLVRSIVDAPELAGIPVICCTAGRGDAPSGCAAVLRKPFDGPELERALRTAFARSAARA